MARAKKVAGPDGGAVIIGSADELKDIVFCLQAEKKVVVLTSGIFDLLHVGHIRYLKDARSRGDYLVVAVASDASVKKFKNPKLPIIIEEERVEMVSALRWVDYVIRYDGETCDALIETVKPDILARGTDSTPEEVPERATVEEYGGAVAICGDAKDHATSKIITRIRRIKK